MIANYKINNLKFLYNFFLLVSLIIYFFSTTQAQGKAFDIDNIEISRPFEMNFNKNEVLDDGFRKAFLELLLLIVNSSDQKKISKVQLNEIKGMIESFSIKEEKFIDETYFVNLGVSFNKKKIFNYLEKRNIFPSIPIEKKILFIPIVIDEKKKNLLNFYKNKVFNEWNNDIQNFHLIQYILPTEDLEDLNLIKKNFEFIEQYDFKDVTEKYSLDDSIILLIFKDGERLRILSRININDNLILKNKSFNDVDIDEDGNLKKMINNLKTTYEDYWKNINQVNTSIRLTLNIKVKNKDNIKISNFETILNEKDLIYDFHISKFDKDFVYYQIIFNGTPNNFLKSMSHHDYTFDTQNKLWILK